MIITGKDNKTVVINEDAVEKAKKILDKARNKPQS